MLAQRVSLLSGSGTAAAREAAKLAMFEVQAHIVDAEVVDCPEPLRRPATH